jgi:hypothetical protein
LNSIVRIVCLSVRCRSAQRPGCSTGRHTKVPRPRSTGPSGCVAKAASARSSSDGDTDFTQTKHLDRWDADGVQFLFGVNGTANLQVLADDLPENAWQALRRPPRYEVQTEPRCRPEKVKEAIVVEREFKNIRLVSERVAEFDYRPSACRQSYRLIVVRKNLSVAKGEKVLFEDYRSFFYLTNDRTRTTAEIVFAANDRCNQENLHAQLKHGVCALQAPVDNLVSNRAYMVMTALAWNLKAWLALQLPPERLTRLRTSPVLASDTTSGW